MSGIRKIAKRCPVFDEHEKFLKYVTVDRNTQCWNWTGSFVEHTGYGRFSFKAKAYTAHRVSYSIFKEEPPINMVVDHLCRNRKCVNPEHLRTVDTKTNLTENSIAGAAINKRKTHCWRGHEFTSDNTYTNRRGHRECRKCHIISNNKFRKKEINQILGKEEGKNEINL